MTNAPEKLVSILLERMRCRKCSFVCTVLECEPDCDGDGSLGCPREDCGGIMERADLLDTNGA